MMILRSLLSKRNKYVFLCEILFVLSLLQFFGCEKQAPPDVTDPGQKLFLGFANEEVNCSRCHGQDGLGADKGPDLTKVFKKYDEDKIAEIIEEGKGLGKNAMPPFEGKITEEDVDNLINFLKTIQVVEQKE